MRASSQNRYEGPLYLAHVCPDALDRLEGHLGRRERPGGHRHRSDPTGLMPGSQAVSRRNEPVNGLPLRVLVLRRALESGYALDRMVEYEFLTADAALILRDAAQAADNIVIAGPSSSARTSLLYAAMAETPLDQRVLVIEEPEWAQARLSLPLNAELANPIARLGLANVIREELRSETPPDILVLDEITNWAVSLAITATLAGKCALWGTVRGRDTERAVGHLTMLTAGDKLRAAQSRAEIEAEVLHAFDLIVTMERREDRAFVARISRPNPAGKLETVYKARRVRNEA